MHSLQLHEKHKIIIITFIVSNIFLKKNLISTSWWHFLSTTAVLAASRAREETVVVAMWHVGEWHGAMVSNSKDEVMSHGSTILIAWRRQCTMVAEKHGGYAVGGSGQRQIWGLGLYLEASVPFFYSVRIFTTTV